MGGRIRGLHGKRSFFLANLMVLWYNQVKYKPKQEKMTMIFDSLKFCEQYCSLHKHLRAVFDFLEKATREDLPVGRYELEGKELFAMVQEYSSHLPEEVSFEGHLRYIDVQYVLSGVEVMDASTYKDAQPKTEYNEEKDVQFFEDHAAPVTCTVRAGEFVIFFPQDLHKPGMCANRQPAPVKKVVVKIAL